VVDEDVRLDEEEDGAVEDWCEHLAFSQCIVRQLKPVGNASYS